MNFRGLNNNPLLKGRISLVGFFLVVGMIFYLTSYAPARNEIVAISGKVKNLQQGVERDKTLVADLEKYVKRLQEVSESYEMLAVSLVSKRELMPQSDDVLATLREVTAPQPGLVFISIEPTAKRIMTGFTVLPVSLHLRGSFSSLGVFLSRIEKSSRPMAVENITITRDTKPGLSAVLDLSIFMSSEDSH